MCTTNLHDDGTICTCEAIESTHSPGESREDHQHGHGTAHKHAHTSSPIFSTTEIGVEGMTCSHCVASVSNELGRLDGVTNVEIALVAGGISRITIASEAALATSQVAAAIAEAGYELVELPQ